MSSLVSEKLKWQLKGLFEKKSQTAARSLIDRELTDRKTMDFDTWAKLSKWIDSWARENPVELPSMLMPERRRLLTPEEQELVVWGAYKAEAISSGKVAELLDFHVTEFEDMKKKWEDEQSRE